MFPSQFPEADPYPALGKVFAAHVDMQFADLHAVLRLPIEEIDPHVGLNLTATALIFSLIAGASVLLHNPSWRAFKSGAASGARFQSVLVDAYPWGAEDDPIAQDAASLLYKSARNPLVHSLGIGKDRRAIPGAQVAQPYDRIIFVKWALCAPQIESLAVGGEARPSFLPATICRVNDSIELSVPTLAWGVHVMWRKLMRDPSHAVAAEGIARQILCPS